MNLYEYQTRAVQMLADTMARHRRVCLVAPTGSGKTVMACEIIRRALEKKRRVLFTVHRTELLDQAQSKLRLWGINSGAIKAGRDEDRDQMVQVASTQTLGRRNLPPSDIVICDEAHRRDHAKITARYPLSWIIGLTATPTRLNGSGMADEYDAMVQAATYSELIGMGVIVPARVWGINPPDLSKIAMRGKDYDDESAGQVMRGVTGDVVQTWRDRARGLKTIVYCCTIQHAKEVESNFRDAGVTCCLITGDTPANERALNIERFRLDRGLDVIVNVGVFVEGLDVPELQCVVMARPTNSLSLYLQMAGRGCRSVPGKSNYLLLDHAGNCIAHGAPHIDRPWVLRRGNIVAKKNSEPARQCKLCYYIYDPRDSPKSCPSCHAIQPPRRVRYRAGVLVELAEEQLKPKLPPAEAYRRHQWAIAKAVHHKNPKAFVDRRMEEWRAKLW